jgi:hypothetical protein
MRCCSVLSFKVNAINILQTALSSGVTWYKYFLQIKLEEVSLTRFIKMSCSFTYCVSPYKISNQPTRLALVKF